MKIMDEVESFLGNLDDYKDCTFELKHIKRKGTDPILLLTYLDLDNKKHGFGKIYKGDIK